MHGMGFWGAPVSSSTLHEHVESAVEANAAAASMIFEAPADDL